MAKSDMIGAVEAGVLLGVTPRQVRRMVINGILRARMVGGTLVIRRGDVEKVPAERKSGPKLGSKRKRKPGMKAKPGKRRSPGS